MRRTVIVMAMAVLALLLAAAAAQGQSNSRVQCLHVVNQARIDQFNLRWAESAITYQANTQVRPVWHTATVRFCDHGWPVYLKQGPGPKMGGKHPIHKREIGYHEANSRPFAVIYVSDEAPWVQVLDHEVLEMMVDPWTHRAINGTLVEICDPVEHHPYVVWGRRLADWVTPAWFGKKVKTANDTKSGPTDWLGVTSAPLQVSGGFMPVTTGEDDGM